MKEYLQLIDTNTSGPRCDVTPLFANPLAFAQLIHDLIAPFDSAAVDYVAGIDALGFILGTAMAVRLEKGFIPIRKQGKLPVAAIHREFVDYTGHTKALELGKGCIPGGARILIADEWIETGAQMQAAVDLIEQEKGIVVGIAAINIDSNPLSDRLRARYKCHAVWYNMDENGQR